MNSRTHERLESRRLRELAREYEGLGYRVTIHPDRSELPAFLADFEPDLIAEGAKGSVVVEVKSRPSLRDSDDLQAMTRAIEGKAGWEMELVVTNPKGEDPAREEGDALTLDEVRGRLDASTMLLGRGMLDLALVAACSAAEGAMRRAAARQSVPLEDHAPAYMAKALYTFGLIDRESLDILDRALAARDRVVHAYRAADLDPGTVERLIEFVHGLIETC